MSKNDGGRMNPKTFAQFLLKDEPDNYADLLWRVREVRKEIAEHMKDDNKRYKDSREAYYEGVIDGLVYVDGLLDRLVPEANWRRRTGIGERTARD